MDDFNLRLGAEKKLKATDAAYEELINMPADRMAGVIQELRVHQIELEMQNDELRSIQGELENTRDRYSHLYDFAPVGYFTVNEKGIVTEANLTAATLLGVTRSALIGSPFSRFILREDQDGFYIHRVRLLETKTRQTCEARLVKKGGASFYAQLECVPEQDVEASINLIRITVTDISELKRAEKALKEVLEGLEKRVEERTAELTESNKKLIKEIEERRAVEEKLRLEERRLEALLKLNQMTDVSVKNIADFVLEEGEKLTKSKLGFLGFMNETETELAVHAWSNSAKAECSMNDKPIHYPIEESGLWGDAVRQRKPVIANDYSVTHLQKKGLPEGHVKIFRYLGVPFFYKDLIVAVMGVANKEGEYDESDIRQLTLLLDGMLRIVRNREIEEELQHLSSRLLEAHEDEGKRIRQELHDGLAQTLAAIKIWGENGCINLKCKKSGEAINSFENIISLAKGAVEEARRISMNLRPTILDDLGLLPTISWLCKDFKTIYPGIEIETRVELSEKDVPDSLKIIIFRVIQEALNNIVKHSRASLVRLSLIREKSTLELLINDNGVGFNSDRIFSGDPVMLPGLGLASMRERAAFSDGSFSVKSQKGQGSTILVSWKCDS